MIFSKFERLVAKRYLRAKRKEGFISVITGFAFTGIALGRWLVWRQVSHSGAGRHQACQNCHTDD